MLRGWMNVVDCPPEHATSPDGVVYSCCLNIFHRSMVHDPDPSTWITQVAYALPPGGGG
jgi:hypothetical protein